MVRRVPPFIVDILTPVPINAYYYIYQNEHSVALSSLLRTTVC